MQEQIEETVLDMSPKDVTREILLETVTRVLEDLKTDTELFQWLFRSFRHRLDLVIASGGKNIGRMFLFYCYKKNGNLS